MLEILIVHGDSSEQKSVVEALRAGGHQVTVSTDGAASLLKTRAFDVVMADVQAPGVDGLAMLRRLRAESPSTDVILTANEGQIREAVIALREGARDYIAKPVDADEIALRIQRIDERRAVQRELAAAKTALAREQTGPIVLGRSPSMARLVYLIETFARSDAPVLIHGESGTGKELVAHRIHDLSSRSGRPFVAVNCAAFPETLLEAELFGHERGAFTGAMHRRDGRFKAADGGTLFLDEVAEMPPSAQAKLLRVLQEGVFEPLGTNTPTKVDVRVVSATHRNLKDRIGQGRFREDLYFRLKVLAIDLAPLRARRGDLPLLVQHFLRRFSPTPQDPPGISPRAWAALYEYSFPGNVRELEHALQHASVLSRSRGAKEIDLEDLPPELAAMGLPEATPGGDPFRPLRMAIREFEREYLLRALKATHGRKARAAQMLGVSRKALWKKLTSHGINSLRIGDVLAQKPDQPPDGSDAPGIDSGTGGWEAAHSGSPPM